MSAFRERRRAIGLTQAELAVRLGTTTRQIRRFERRDEISPTLDLALEALASRVWAEHLAAIAAWTLVGAVRRDAKREARRARRRARIALQLDHAEPANPETSKKESIP